MKGQDLELINITTCTDVQKIIQYYYYGLCVKYISNDGIESVEWISGRQLTYDTKRRHELVSITGDGVYYLKDRELFKNCVNLIELPKNVIVTVNDMSNMFYRCKKLNCNINNWDVSYTTNMSGMFSYSNFNRDISKWNVREVEDMSEMFTNSKFNSDIGGWDVRNVENMEYMFYDSEFNKDVIEWNVHNVKNMECMFYRSAFNGDISNWNTRSETNIGEMFY